LPNPDLVIFFGIFNNSVGIDRKTDGGDFISFLLLLGIMTEETQMGIIERDPTDYDYHSELIIMCHF